MEQYKTQRVLTVSIDVADPQRLKNIAATASRFANELLTARYVRAKKLKPPAIYTDYSGDLSGYVRDGMNSEVKGIWGRFAKQILAGHRSLPLFSSDRSLCVRDRGVKVVKDGDGFNIEMQFLPKGNEWFSYPVSTYRLKKDLWLSGLLGRLADGTHRIAKGTICFDRRNPCDIVARITYQKTIDPNFPGGMTARLGSVGENGELYVRCSGKNLSLTHYVQELQNKKRDLAKIWQRVRLSKRRDAMRKTEKFEQWANGPLHKLARVIVQFAFENKCKRIEWRIENKDDLPWHKLKSFIAYKAKERGVELVKEKGVFEKRKPERREVQWARQANKSLRELGQATRKL